MLHLVDIHLRGCLCMVVTFPYVSSTFASLVSELSLGRASIRCNDGRGRHVYFILYSRFVPIFVSGVYDSGPGSMMSVLYL